MMTKSVKIKGITLIELLIVLSIISVIGAFTLPSYQKYVNKTERYQAQADLYKLQIWLEQKYTAQATYPNKLSCLECQLSNLYDFSVSIKEDKTSYLLTATPKPNTRQHNDECFTQTLDHLSTQANIDMHGNKIEGKKCWK